MDPGLLARALALGLSANFWCAGACLPVLAPYVMGHREGARAGLGAGTWFTLGRLPLYLLLGAAAGLAGGTLLEGQALWLTVGMRLVLAGLIMLYGFATALSWNPPRLCRLWRRKGPFGLVLGALITSVACPPLALLLADVFASGDLVGGALALVVFWASSSVLILTASLVSGGLAARINREWEEGRLREVTGWVLVMVGIMFLWTLT